MKNHEVVITGRIEADFRKVMQIPDDELEDFIGNPDNLANQIDWDDVKDEIKFITSMDYTVDGKSP